MAGKPLNDKIIYKEKLSEIGIYNRKLVKKLN